MVYSEQVLFETEEEKENFSQNIKDEKKNLIKKKEEIIAEEIPEEPI